MERDEFGAAVEYGLSQVGKADLTLKPQQIDAIRHVYNGKDVFLWLPTGFGKSVCYEVLPFVMDRKRESEQGSHSIVLVISPLVSLMIDQVSSLRQRGVTAGILSGHPGVSSELLIGRASDIGKYRFLFSAPEAIIGVDKWREVLLSAPLSHRIVAVAVDEAHCVSKWSLKFRPTYGRLHEIRALVPSGTPLLAATATVTPAVRQDVIELLDMKGCELVCVSPDRPNICYEVKPRTDIETDFKPLVNTLLAQRNEAERIIVYCRSLNSVADLYAHFLYILGSNSYYPHGAEHISDNRLFGMYHANTSQHNKDVIQRSMQDPDGVVRIVFATVALGMGVNMVGVNTTWHYGAPASLEDYLQESGRGGRTGQQAKSVVFWKPADAPMRRDQSIAVNAELAAVRRYLENTLDCRRVQLLHHFDPDLSRSLPPRDPLFCCDVCACTLLHEN
jgi:RecQ family ATP-dependent DNA helicase